MLVELSLYSKTLTKILLALISDIYEIVTYADRQLQCKRVHSLSAVQTIQRVEKYSKRSGRPTVNVTAN